MTNRIPLPLAAIAALAGVATAGSALAQPTIRLFGLDYQVQRFDYSQQVSWPNPWFPGTPDIRMFESEGLHWAGNNKLYMSADDINDRFRAKENWVVEVNVQTLGNQVTGLAYSRTIVSSGPLTLVAGGPNVGEAYDINPGGVTVNTGTTGIGRGGNLLVLNTGIAALNPFSLQPATLGQPLEWPDNSGCAPGSCSLTVPIAETEDVAFVPAAGSRAEALYFLDQNGSAVYVTDTAGAAIAGRSFPVGNGADQTVPATAEPKGLSFVPDSPRLPLNLRGRGGVVLVAFDATFPAIQAFSVDGVFLGTERLELTPPILSPDPVFFDDIPGTYRLDFSGCTSQLVPGIESLAMDPGAGRMFVSNQGNFTDCNFMWVLTPCVADFNLDGQRNVQDIFVFLSSWFAGAPESDIDGLNGRNVADIFQFLSRWFAGC